MPAAVKSSAWVVAATVVAVVVGLVVVLLGDDDEDVAANAVVDVLAAGRGPSRRRPRAARATQSPRSRSDARR